MKELIRNNRQDPFDRKKTCEKVIKNFIAKELFDLSEEVERRYKLIDDPINCSKAIQTDKVERMISRSCGASIGEAVSPNAGKPKEEDSKESSSKAQEIQDLKFKLNFTKQALKLANMDLKKAKTDGIKESKMGEEVKELIKK